MGTVCELCGYILSRVLQTVLVLLVLLYIWSSRAVAASLVKRARSVLCGSSSKSQNLTEKQYKFRRRVEKEYLKWRLDIHSLFLRVVLPVLTVDSVLVVVLLNESHEWQFLLTRVLITVVAYCFCVLVNRGTIAFTARFFDVVFVLFIFVYVGRSYAHYRGIQIVSKRFRRVAPIMRALISATYLNFPRAVFGNAIISVLEMIFYSLFIGGIDVDWILEAFTELFDFALTLILAYVMEAGGRSNVTHRLEAKSSADGWRAVHSILSVLCDAVVHLGSDLTILDECPHLGHLLMSGVGASHKLEGGNFLRHVVDDDKERLNSFISKQSELAKQLEDVTSDEASEAAPIPAAGPAALHISLKDSMGTVFRVEVIHAHLPNFDEDGHLLGVRDLGDYAREELVDALPSHVPADAIPRRQHRSCTLSSRSSGSREAQKWMDSGKLQSFILQVDHFDPRFPISEATLMFQSLGDEVEPAGERDFNLPFLSALLPKRESTKFLHWAENASNCLYHGENVLPFGRMTLRFFGSNVRLKAKRVSANMSEETDTFRFVFDDVHVQLSELLGRSSTSLPCIREQYRAPPTPVSASRVLSSYGNAQHQVHSVSESSNPHAGSSMRLTL
eukprot:TRINITY_DN7713_c0_g1_i2.p1 TRINITY_DN7713_c0_g1~~TRINITY_DN7713_c0_g1_i2.p1  ORF type:complete len:636 (-),score=58.76 TRINITY_DN7713_c0_g1_i2:250-2100(-)